MAAARDPAASFARPRPQSHERARAMTSQELQQFLQTMAAVREANTASPEKARQFLKEEGVLTADGHLAEPYAPKAASPRT